MCWYFANFQHFSIHTARAQTPNIDIFGENYDHWSSSINSFVNTNKNHKMEKWKETQMIYIYFVLFLFLCQLQFSFNYLFQFCRIFIPDLFMETSNSYSVSYFYSIKKWEINFKFQWKLDKCYCCVLIISVLLFCVLLKVDYSMKMFSFQCIFSIFFCWKI